MVIKEKNMTCFGCEYIIFEYFGDGSILYGCKLCSGLVTGESSLFDEEDDPKRCDKYKTNNNRI